MKLVEFPGERVPPGFFRCESCGEYNGTTKKENLSWHGTPLAFEMCPEVVEVRCLCRGIPCPSCKTNLIHRPISNSYDAPTNSAWHWPYFSGLRSCRECRKREEALKNKNPNT